MHAKTFCKTRKNGKRELFINKYKNITAEKAFEKHDKTRQKRKLCVKVRKNYEKQTISDKKQQNGSKNMSSDRVTASTDDCNKTPTFTLPLPPAIQAEKIFIVLLQKKVVKSEKNNFFGGKSHTKKLF